MNPRWRLACGWVTLFVIGTDLFIISPLLPAISVDFNRSTAAAGLSVTAFSLTYLMAAPLLGWLADRIGRRRVLIACLLAFAAANLLTGLATGFIALLATRVVAGAGAAGVSPSIYAGVGGAAPAGRRATWMAVAVSGLLLALSVGAPAGAMLAAHWGWRTPFLALAALSLVLIVANAVVWPADKKSLADALGPPGPGTATMVLLLSPTVLWASALYGVYTYLGTWLTGAGLSSPQIAQAIGCYGAGALAGALLGGHAADRFGTAATMLTSLAGLAICLMVFGLGVGTGWSADLLLLVTSIFAQLFFPAQQSALSRLFPHRRAFILAMNNSALFLGISLGSLLGGQAMARAGFSADAAMGAVIACLALLVVATATRSSRLIEAAKELFQRLAQRVAF
jgi:predicted MFS family arabinose efflux permease